MGLSEDHLNIQGASTPGLNPPSFCPREGVWQGSAPSAKTGISTSFLDKLHIDFWIPAPIDKTSASMVMLQCDPSGHPANGVRLGASTGAATDEVITVLDDAGGNPRTFVQNITIPAGRNLLDLEWSSGDSRYNISLNGVAQTVVANSGGHAQRSNQNLSGTNLMGGAAFAGVLNRMIITRQDGIIHTYAPTGTAPKDWVDRTGGDGRPTLNSGLTRAISHDCGDTWSQA